MEVIEEFATGFDSMPVLFDGRDDYRVLVKSGVLVRAMEVIGVRSQDGAVELVGLELDLRMEWD